MNPKIDAISVEVTVCGDISGASRHGPPVYAGQGLFPVRSSQQCIDHSKAPYCIWASARMITIVDIARSIELAALLPSALANWYPPRAAPRRCSLRGTRPGPPRRRLEENQAEDDVLVLGRIHRAPQGVGHAPQLGLVPRRSGLGGRGSAPPLNNLLSRSSPCHGAGYITPSPTLYPAQPRLRTCSGSGAVAPPGSRTNSRCGRCGSCALRPRRAGRHRSGSGAPRARCRR